MQASITTPARQNGENLDQSKERTHTLLAVAPTSSTDPTPRIYVEARFWMGRRRAASTVYCSVWVHAPGVYASGYGTAAGCGYHRPSAALSAALQSAGITLSERISAAGECAMADAMRAVAIAAGAPADHVAIL